MAAQSHTLYLSMYVSRPYTTTAYERRVREQKLRVEMMQAKKENALFTQLVEQKKQIQGMESRKVSKKKDWRRSGLLHAERGLIIWLDPSLFDG